MEGLHHEAVGVHPHRRGAVARGEHVELVGVVLLHRPRQRRTAVGPRRHRRARDVELVAAAHVGVLQAPVQGQVRPVRGRGQQGQRDHRPAESCGRHGDLQRDAPGSRALVMAISNRDAPGSRALIATSRRRRRRTSGRRRGRRSGGWRRPPPPPPRRSDRSGCGPRRRPRGRSACARTRSGS